MPARLKRLQQVDPRQPLDSLLEELADGPAGTAGDGAGFIVRRDDWARSALPQLRRTSSIATRKPGPTPQPSLRRHPWALPRPGRSS
jgi:hypothetical protein